MKNDKPIGRGREINEPNIELLARLLLSLQQGNGQ
jgi:hypothetical protein